MASLITSLHSLTSLHFTMKIERGFGAERARLGSFRGFGTERARLGTFKALAQNV